MTYDSLTYDFFKSVYNMSEKKEKIKIWIFFIALTLALIGYGMLTGRYWIAGVWVAGAGIKYLMDKYSKKKK